LRRNVDTARRRGAATFGLADVWEAYEAMRRPSRRSSPSRRIAGRD